MNKGTKCTLLSGLFALLLTSCPSPSGNGVVEPTDTDAPRVLSIAVDNDAKTLKVMFSEKLGSFDKSKISVFKEKLLSPENPNSYDITIDAKQLIITFKKAFTGSDFSVLLKVDAVKDTAGNGFKEEKRVDPDTNVNPVKLAVGSNLTHDDNVLVVKFAVELKSVVKGKLEVIKNGEKISDPNKYSADVSGNTVRISLTDTPKIGETYSVKFLAGAIIDTHDNPSSEEQSSSELTISTLTPPNLAEKDNLVQSLNTLTVKFDKALKDQPIPKDKIEIHHNKTRIEVDKYSLAIKGSTFVINLADSLVLAMGDTLKVVVISGAVANIHNLSNTKNMTTSTITVRDEIAPKLLTPESLTMDVLGTLKVRFNENLSSTVQKSRINILINEGIVEDNQYTVSVSESNLSITLSRDLKDNNKLQVIFLAGAVSDTTGNATTKKLTTNEVTVLNSGPPELIEDVNLAVTKDDKKLTVYFDRKLKNQAVDNKLIIVTRYSTNGKNQDTISTVIVKEKSLEIILNDLINDNESFQVTVKTGAVATALSSAQTTEDQTTLKVTVGSGDDTIGPALSSRVLEIDQRQKILKLAFNEILKADQIVDKSLIQVNISGDDLGQNAYNLSIEGNKLVISIISDLVLEQGTEIRVTVGIGAVADPSGNRNDKQEQTNTATASEDITAPLITDVVIADKSVTVSFGEQVNILNWSGIVFSLDGTELTRNTDYTSLLNENFKSIIFSRSQDFTVTNIIKIVFGGGAVEDIAGNRMLATTIVDDITPPSLNAGTVLQMDTADKTLTVSFNEPLKTLDNSGVTVVKNPGSDETTLGITDYTLKRDNDKVIIKLTDAAFDSSLVYKVTFADGAVTDKLDKPNVRFSVQSRDITPPRVLKSYYDMENDNFILVFNEKIKKHSKYGTGSFVMDLGNPNKKIHYSYEKLTGFRSTGTPVGSFGEDRYIIDNKKKALVHGIYRLDSTYFHYFVTDLAGNSLEKRPFVYYFLVDKRAPVFQSIKYVSHDSGWIELNFNENIFINNADDAGNITIMQTVSGTNTDRTDSFDKIISDKSLRLIPKDGYSFSEANYTVTIGAKAIRDSSNNVNEASLTQSIILNLDFVEPDLANEPLTRSDRVFTLTFSEALKSINAGGITLYHRAPGQLLGSPISRGLTKSGLSSDGLSMTLTLMSTPGYGEYWVTVNAGALTDRNNNINSNALRSNTVENADKIAPMLISNKPIRISPRNQNMTITFDEAIKILAEDKLSISYSGSGAPLESQNYEVTLKTGNTVLEFKFPDITFAHGDTFVVTMEEGAISDLSDNLGNFPIKTLTVVEDVPPKVTGFIYDENEKEFHLLFDEPIAEFSSDSSNLTLQNWHEKTAQWNLWAGVYSVTDPPSAKLIMKTDRGGVPYKTRWTFRLKTGGVTDANGNKFVGYFDVKTFDRDAVPTDSDGKKYYVDF